MIFPSDTSFLDVSWTWQAHSPAILHLLPSAYNALPTSLGLSPKESSLVPYLKFSSPGAISFSLLCMYHFLNSYQSCLFSISFTRKWAQGRQRFWSALLSILKAQSIGVTSKYLLYVVEYTRLHIHRPVICMNPKPWGHNERTNSY